MLENIPAWLGQALNSFRAGADKLCIAQPELGPSFGAIDLSSPAFGNGGVLPQRFTADGEGISPPLFWGNVPRGTRSLALIVEAPDAPTPEPVVHAIVWGIQPFAHVLDEGSIRPDGTGREDGIDVGRNSLFLEGWLPPDPPPGHGDHAYAFQLFALDTIDFPGPTPGRGSLVEAMKGRVLAAGLLIGTYARAEAADAGEGIIGIAFRTI